MLNLGVWFVYNTLCMGEFFFFSDSYKSFDIKAWNKILIEIKAQAIELAQHYFTTHTQAIILSISNFLYAA